MCVNTADLRIEESPEAHDLPRERQRTVPSSTNTRVSLSPHAHPITHTRIHTRQKRASCGPVSFEYPLTCTHSHALTHRPRKLPIELCLNTSRTCPPPKKKKIIADCFPICLCETPAVRARRAGCGNCALFAPPACFTTICLLVCFVCVRHAFVALFSCLCCLLLVVFF